MIISRTLLEKDFIISMESTSGHNYVRKEGATEWILEKLDEIELRVAALEQGTEQG